MKNKANSIDNDQIGLIFQKIQKEYVVLSNKIL